MQKGSFFMEKKDKEKSFTSVGINWYPGHMAKTRKQVIQDLKLVDIVIEILDARIPISSQNPDMAEITKGKKKMVILNKCDLADDRQNALWVKFFQNKGITAVLTDSNYGKGIEESIKQVQKIMEEDMNSQVEKGRIGRKRSSLLLFLYRRKIK